MSKDYFKFTKNSLEKSEHLFKKTFDKGLLTKKENFIAMNAYEWDEFLKFILELDKELKKSDSIRHMILTSAIAVERFMDILFIRIYDLNSHEKIDAYEFLANIPFGKKIELLTKFKKKYKKKKPKAKDKNHFRASAGFIRALSKKGLLEDLVKIEQELNGEKNIPSAKRGVFIIPPREKEKDYLPDDVIDVFKQINLKKFEKIKILRNKVAHKWNYKEEIAKKLKTSKRQLSKSVKDFCLEALNNLPTLSLK